MGVSPAFFVPRHRTVAVFLFALLSFAVALQGQRRHAPSPLDTLGGDVSQEEGWQILRQFRSLGVSGDYRFRFQLRILPRRGQTSTVAGTMLGSMNEQGPISRVDVVLEEASIGPKGELIPARVQSLLLQNGLFSQAYELSSENGEPEPRPIPPDRQFETIGGSEFTVFDLLMPFTYWQRFVYEGRTTFRSRPTHVFWLYPPDEDELTRARVSGVRVFLDEEFYALIKTEIYAPDRQLAKTLLLGRFKRVDGHWILGEVEVRNEKTRDKTQLRVVDASMDLDLPPAVFSLDGLSVQVHGRSLSDL